MHTIAIFYFWGQNHARLMAQAIAEGVKVANTWVGIASSSPTKRDK